MPGSGADGPTWSLDVLRWLLVPLLTLFIVLPLLRPGAASAATASVGGPPAPFDLTRNALYFRAAAGETNRVTIELVGSETIVKDDAALLRVGAGCRSLDAHSASCTAPPIGPPPPPGVESQGPLDGFVAYLGGGDDGLTVTLPSSISNAVLVVDGGPGEDLVDASRAHTAGARGSEGAHLRGGPGRDTLRAGPGLNWLWGGPGKDTLDGGPGRSVDWLWGGADADVLRGGGGDDLLSGDGPAHSGSRGDDLLDGGAGTDSVGYVERVKPVVVDLARGRGGRPGERDRLRSIERASGGFGPDVLLGDGRGNGLSGLDSYAGDPYSPPASAVLRGGDVLVGRGGDDALSGTAAGARFDGGPGNDVLDSRSRRDRPSCGPGRDKLAVERNGRLVPRDCERITVRGDPFARGAVGKGRAHFSVPARWGPSGNRCAVGVTLRSPAGRRYGGASWPAPGRRNGRVSFALSAAGRRAAALHRIAVVRAACRSPHFRLNYAVSWRIRL